MTPRMLELLDGFNLRVNESAFGVSMKHVKSGYIFRGVLTPMPPVDPTLELGSDWRELSTLEVRNDQCPPMTMNDVLQQQSDPNEPMAFQLAPNWRVIRREDNPSNFTIKLWLVKFVQGTDAILSSP